MRTVISGSKGSIKLKLTEDKDQILIEQACQRDLGQTTLNALNVKIRGRGYKSITKIQIHAKKNVQIEEQKKQVQVQKTNILELRQ